MSSTAMGIRFYFGEEVIHLPPILGEAAGRSVKQDIHAFLRDLDQNYRKKNNASLYAREVSRAISNTLEESLHQESEEQKRAKFEAFITPGLKQVTEEIEKLIEKHFNRIYKDKAQYWSFDDLDICLDDLKGEFADFQRELKMKVQLEFSLAQNLFSIDADYRHGPNIEELKQLSAFSGKTAEEIYKFSVMSLVSHCHLNFGERMSRNLYEAIEKETVSTSKSYHVVFLSDKNSIPENKVAGDNTFYFQVEDNKLAIYQPGAFKRLIPACKLFIKKDENGIKKTVDVSIADLSQECIEQMKVHLLKEAGVRLDSTRKKLLENTRHIIARYVITGLEQALMECLLVQKAADYNPEVHQQLARVLNEATAQCYETLRRELTTLAERLGKPSIVKNIFLFFDGQTESETRAMLVKIQDKIMELKDVSTSEAFIPKIIEIHNLAANMRLNEMKREKAWIISAISTSIINSAVWNATVVPMIGNAHDLQQLCIELYNLVTQDANSDCNVTAFKGVVLDILKEYPISSDPKDRQIRQNMKKPTSTLKKLYNSLTEILEHTIKMQTSYDGQAPPIIVDELLTTIQTNETYRTLKRRYTEQEVLRRKPSL